MPGFRNFFRNLFGMKTKPKLVVPKFANAEEYLRWKQSQGIASDPKELERMAMLRAEAEKKRAEANPKKTPPKRHP
jgi:hypothetical protein